LIACEHTQLAHLHHGNAKLLEELCLVLGIELDELQSVRGTQELCISVEEGTLGQDVLEVGIVEEVLGDEVKVDCLALLGGAVSRQADS
jgi:hypothetical protein